MSIILQNITKKYGNQIIFDNFNLEIDDNKITAIMGKSGQGKTTLLRIISSLTDYSGSVSGNAGEISYVFQDARLLKNLTAVQNLEYILDSHDYYKAKEMLEKIGMNEDADKYPNSLSGGMAQRISIARAFLHPSSLMLMDEPFKNLDIGMKVKLIELTKQLWQESSKTTVFVTHDISEALLLANRIVVINQGKIIFDKENDLSAPCEYGKSNLLKEELFNLMLNA